MRIARSYVGGGGLGSGSAPSWEKPHGPADPGGGGGGPGAMTPGAGLGEGTFNAISVRSPHTGDKSGTAVVEYRQGAGAWKPAYTPYHDHRTTIPVNGGGTV